MTDATAHDVTRIHGDLVSEATADVGRDHVDLVFRDTGDERDDGTVRVRRLRGEVELQPSASPDSCRDDPHGSSGAG